jgi:spermidine synthase
MSARAPSYFLLLLLFVGSGCAALIYEIVWFQLLQQVIGSSAVSLAVLLGTFMGGMCLGSLALPRYLGAHRHPLRTYAWLEIGIGLAGLGVLVTMPVISHLYTALAGYGLPSIFLRACVGILCLLPPTVLMGATLPAVARWVGASPRGLAWLGFFYGGNTLGAVIGCLLAGFYLLRVYDATTATLWAVVMNTGVAALAFVLSRSEASPVGSRADDPTPTAAQLCVNRKHGPSERTIWVAIAISGFCALGAEVVWTRNLSLLLGATVYTFSIILAVFLAGLGLGSSAGAAATRAKMAPATALAICQFLQVLAIAWAAYTIAHLLPYWTITLSPKAPIATKFMLDLMRCALAILPSAVLWGASFPIAMAAAAQKSSDASILVSRTYAANTLGAIGGALLTALLLIPLGGTQATQMLLIALSAGSALLAWQPRRRREWALAAAGVAVAVGIGRSLPRIPWQLVAYGRQIATTEHGAWPLYFGEGMNSSVAVTEMPGGTRVFHVSGKTEASSLPKDMRLQRLLGHLPALLHREPQSVLIVGCGAGVTAGSFVLHPSIRRIVICDIEPLIPHVVANYFKLENHAVLDDPRVEVIYDDARHFIATTHEKFDIITSDPIHPWVKGSAALYSQEYFELCQRHLHPGGLVTQWVPLYEASLAVVQSEIATFLSVFPNGTIWSNDDEGFGYDTVLLGQAQPLEIDVDALRARFQETNYQRVGADLEPLGLGNALDLLSTYAGRKQDIATWLATAEINRDRNLRLQYLAGTHLDSNQGEKAHLQIVERRKFPDDLFKGKTATIIELRKILEDSQNTPVPLTPR